MSDDTIFSSTFFKMKLKIYFSWQSSRYKIEFFKVHCIKTLRVSSLVRREAQEYGIKKNCGSINKTNTPRPRERHKIKVLFVRDKNNRSTPRTGSAYMLAVKRLIFLASESVILLVNSNI